MTKRHYLEHSLLHSELTAILNHHSHSSTHPDSRGTSSSSSNEGRVRAGRELLAAAEAQHCVRLHPDTNLLGLTTDHLRLTGGKALSGVRVFVVCTNLEH